MLRRSEAYRAQSAATLQDIDLVAPHPAPYTLQERSLGSAQRLCRGGRRPLLSEGDLLLPRGGSALVKRLALGVSKVDWTTTFDFVVKVLRRAEAYRAQAAATLQGINLV